MATPTRIAVKTEDGVAACWVHRPDEGAHPGVVMFPDAGGVRPASQAMAERLAGAGYVVLLPSIFYRAGDYAPFDAKTVFGDPPERERLMALVRSLDDASAMRDAAHYIRALKEQPNVKGDRVGVVGYCIGGRVAFTAAGAHAKQIGAAASIHGGGLVSDAPDSPHLLAPSIEARLYLGVADNDKSCSPEHQARLVGALASAHVDFAMEHYRGAAHGFAMEDFPVYDRAACERHWERVIGLFDAAL